MGEAGADLQPESIDVERFVGEALRGAWDTFKADALLYILGALVAVLISAVTLTILAGPMTVGFIDLVRKRRRGQSASVSDLFDGISRRVGSIFAFLLIAVATLIGMALLVLPGIFVLFATCFAFHEIAYRGLSAVDAIKASFEIAKRNVLHVLLLLVGLSLLNAVGSAAVIAFLLTAPFSLVLVTVAYEMLSGQAPARALAVERP